MQPRLVPRDMMRLRGITQADTMGVDIIQHCEVEGFNITNGKITGVRTSREIKAKKVGLCAWKYKY